MEADCSATDCERNTEARLLHRNSFFPTSLCVRASDGLLAFSVTQPDGSSSIVIGERDGLHHRRLTAGDSRDECPCWWHDAKKTGSISTRAAWDERKTASWLRSARHRSAEFDSAKAMSRSWRKTKSMTFYSHALIKTETSTASAARMSPIVDPIPTSFQSFRTSFTFPIAWRGLRFTLQTSFR